MHDDGGLKLLIDRRLSTFDLGGIHESMLLDIPHNLNLHFRVKLHAFNELSPSYAQRRRNMLVSQSLSFDYYSKPSDVISDYERHIETLVDELTSLGVDLVAFTRLPCNVTASFLKDSEVAKIRVRLDL